MVGNLSSGNEQAGDFFNGKSSLGIGKQSTLSMPGQDEQ
jgi:hypothetical protein